MKPFSLIIVLFIAGCSSPSSDDSIVTIDIEKAFNNLSNMFLSDLTDEIEYIPLENVPEALTSEFLRVFANDRYIVAISFRHNHLFDRRTGKFIREISSYGRGPNDYMATNIMVPFDEKEETIRCLDFIRNELIFDFNGKIIRILTYPTEKKSSSMREMIPIDENSFITYVYNYSGAEPVKLIVSDGNGNTLNRFPNYHTFVHRENGSSYSSVLFYKWKKKMFFL